MSLGSPGSNPFGSTGSLHISIADQANAIKAAISRYSVPAYVFMGMYSVETNLGQNIHTSTANAVGPFQFTAANKNTGVLYPMTNTPTLAQFQRQALAAAAYLAANFKAAPAPAHNWHFALMAYNAGLTNAQKGLGSSYADSALAFKIPSNWAAALAGASGILGPASPGGTAGLGGTGTLTNDTANFRVGDPTNPDEDYWTAMNRLAMERYWYLFSDAETLYLTDGPDLMKQTPALEVDRVANAPNISHLDLTYDNTAFQFTATHKKRKHTQRRTALAKVTSPVEAQLNYICAIDEVRAGDVVKLDNCGPGDGTWLAGDVRRSVFEVSSEINLVVALTPLTEAALQPAGINPLNPSSSTPIVVNAPEKVRKMVALAQSLVGAPYSQANHAASFSQTVDQVRRLGTDCSGFVSILLGPKGAGILSSPQTTQTLAGAPGIASGPGKYVTLHDRNTGSVNNEHVIIEMSGYWFESGGNTTFNPHGGVSRMTAAQAAGELRGGAFVPLHPRGM